MGYMNMLNRARTPLNLSQANELERLMVWFDPLNPMELDRVSEETIVKYSKALNEKHWLTYARLAWDIAPPFALYLPHRCDVSSIQPIHFVAM